jgi:hypothetical protein
MGAAAAQEGAKEGANWERRQRKREQKRERGADSRSGSHVSYLYQRVFLTCAIAQERHAHFYMPLAVNCSLPVDVRYLRLSSRGLCLADHVLSQLSPSPQSGASIPVCYLSCHVFAIANCRFSQLADALHWLCRPGPLRTMCLALPSGMGPGGDEVDFWVFVGVPAGMPRR